MSRTDKDRPYIIRAYDKENSHPRYLSHTCNRSWMRWQNIPECDYEKYSTKEVKTLTNTSHRYRPYCGYWLREYRNTQADRDFKVLIHRAERRIQRQRNTTLKYFGDLEPSRYDRGVWLRSRYRD